MELFNAELARTTNLFDGNVAFRLYDTFGFPLDLTQDMLRDKNMSVDMQTFNQCMDAQKLRSKASWKGSGDALKEGDFKSLLSEFGINDFVGYDTTQHKTKILALLDSQFKRVTQIESGIEGYVFLQASPFYPESGGPIGDKGLLFQAQTKDSLAKVIDTKKYFGLNISQIHA